MKKKRSSSVKLENPVESCKEILKYFAKETLVKIELTDEKSLQELKFSFQQNLVKYLQKYPLASQEHARGLELWKMGSRFLNAQISGALDRGLVEIVGDGKEWEEPVTKKARSRAKVLTP